MQAGTRSIYYLCAPNRHLAEHSPYYEAMKQKNTEVRSQGAGPGQRARRSEHRRRVPVLSGKQLDAPRPWQS